MNCRKCRRSYYRWLGIIVMASALDLWSEGRGFDSRPVHCQATTPGKLFTPIVPLSPSSIIWYLVWAFMLRASYVAAMHGSSEQREYCRAVLQRSWLLRTAILIIYFTLLFYSLPPRLKFVAALPREIWIFNCTTLHDSYSIQKCHFQDRTSVQINLQYYSLCSQYPSSAGTYMLFVVHATLSTDASMTPRCFSAVPSVMWHELSQFIVLTDVKWRHQN